MLDANIYRFSEHAVKSADNKKKANLSLTKAENKINELKNRK